MTALAAGAGLSGQERLTAAEWASMLVGLTKDRRHLTSTRLGGDLAEYLSWAATEARKRPRTLDQYERDLARLALMFPTLERGEFTKDENRAWIYSFPGGSQGRVWAAGRSFWGWEYDEDRVERNPMRGIRRPPKPPRKIGRIFSGVERSRLVTAQAQSPLAVRDKACQLLLHETGARQSDLRNLRLEDVNIADRYVIYRDGKGGDDRVVPFGEELQMAMLDFLHTKIGPIYPYARANARREGIPHRPLYREPIGSDHVLYPAKEQDGKVVACWPHRPMASSTFARWWRRCVNRAGIPYLKPHTTRHTYGTDMLDAGVDLLTVSESLGHKSLDTTRLYMHNQRARLRKAQVALELARKGTGEAED